MSQIHLSRRVERRAYHWTLSSLLFVMSILLTQCGGTAGSFSPSYPDNNKNDIQALLERVQKAKEITVRPFVVGVTPDPSKLYGYDLTSKRVLWQTPVRTSISPVIVGNFIITHEGSDIVGRSIEDGNARFKFDAMNMTLVGADSREQFLALALTKGSENYSESAVIAVRNNSILWKNEFQGKVGAPAVIGDTVLVPWNHQNLSAIDAASGEEFARIRLADTVVSHVFSYKSKLFAAGDRAFFEITPNLASGLARNSAFFELPERNIPGEPPLLPDVYSVNPIQPPDSARNRIQLGWRPSAISVISQTNTGFQDNNIYLLFYRFIVAFDPSTFVVRWIYTHPQDMVGIAVQEGGIFYGDSTGHLGFLSAKKGEKLWETTSGVNSIAIQLRLDPVSQFSSNGESLKPEELRKQLMVAANDPDARLVPVRVLVVGIIASLQDSESTANLIELCDSRETTEQVKKAACDALAKREIGPDQVLTALNRHASFLDGTTAPPVGPLAQAAANLKEKKAVGPLLAHLNDPNTRARDLPQLVDALKKLQDPAAIEPLTDFLKLYHADESDEYLIEALGKSADALVALSGPACIEVLKDVADDSMGSDIVRERARVALSILEKQKTAAEKTESAKQAEQKAQAEQAQSEATGDESQTPQRLNQQIVDKTLLPVREQMKACLRNSGAKIFSARVLIMVNEGTVSLVSVLPNTLQSCIEPLVRSQKFPVTKTYGKENVAYNISLR
jgi:outer membrane protein assembly factor BamB